MISWLLALLLLVTPAAAHHEGASGGNAPGVHCNGEGTTREGQLCVGFSDCTGTCTNGWCFTEGDSEPCTVNSDCDGTCDALIWGRDFGHTGTCTAGTCVGSNRACSLDSHCDDPLNYTNDGDSQDPGFIHSSAETLHCYDDTPGRMSVVGADLFYCDNDGLKRRVKRGYEAGTSAQDCFLASGYLKTGSGAFAQGWRYSYIPVMGGNVTLLAQLSNTNALNVTPLANNIVVDDVSCRSQDDVENASSWVFTLSSTTTDSCDDDTSADGAQNDCWTADVTDATACTITGTTGTSDYACASGAADNWRFSAGDLVYFYGYGPGTGGEVANCSWRVCFR